MGGDREGRSLLLPILIISLAITTILLLAVHLWFRPSLHPWGLRERPLLISLWDIEFFYIAKTVFSTLNALLLLSLLAIYVDMYRKTRSEFTVGLIIFSFTLLLYALTSNPLLAAAFGFRPFGLGPFALLPDLFAFSALVVLIYLTAK